MARIEVLHHGLNVGVYDADKLHRVDVDRLRLAAERQTNIMAGSIGTGYLRPGTEHIAELLGDARPIQFVTSDDDAAILLFSDLEMQVYDRTDHALVTRLAVSTAITSGDFSASTGWTLSTASGQSTAISGGKLTMSARAHGAKAVASASASVSAPDQAVEHALRIDVDRGPVTFKLGTTSGGDDLIRTATLRTGTHSLAFTPGAATIYLEFSTEDPVNRIVDSVTVEAAGTMTLPTLWGTDEIDLIRPEQSLDVLYVACKGIKEQRVERYGNHSWSVVDYDRADGPFQAGRAAQVKLTPGALEGNTTLTASGNFFKPEHVGSMFRLFHEGQKVDTYLVGQGASTPAFMVSGITETNFEERKFDVTISGTWVGTLRHRRAYGASSEFGDYVDFRRAQAVSTIDITANATYTNDDNDDNLDVWVKMGFYAYTSGEARVQFTYQGGGGFGICRVVEYVSATVANVEILVPFKGLTAVTDWRQSRWDGVNGYPAAVSFADGRLSWSGNDLFDASVSDAYESFDEEFSGEAGPLSRSIALGGRNDVKWSLSLSSLMLGAGQRIANVRASSLDEILTPDNFGVKSSGNIGVAPISPAELADDRAVFVQASGRALYELTWSSEKVRYVASPFTKLTTEPFRTGIKGLAVQTLPDQRVWVSTVAGDAVCIIFEPTQQVLGAHIPISTSSETDFFRYFAVLPDAGQDRVYAVVKRVVDGDTVYYLERFAQDDEALVDDVCKVMDSHVTGTGAHATTITGLDHLEGREVVAWVDGAPVLDATITDKALDNSKVFTVTGGGIELPVAPTLGYCVGLRYVGQYKSARLAYGVEGYTPMLRNKSLAKLGLLLSDYVRTGVRYGVTRLAGDFNAPWSLPEISDATGTTAAAVVAGPDDDEQPFPAGDNISLDMRVCIEGASPKPFSIRSLVLAIEAK